MPPFQQYTTDNDRQDASGLKRPDADPFISENVSPVHDAGYAAMLGRAQSDSNTDPELEQGPVPSTFEDLFSLTHSEASQFSTITSPNQQRQVTPLECNELRRQTPPSTDSPSSKSSSSVVNFESPNTNSRKRKSPDSVFSIEDSGPSWNHTSIHDQSQDAFVEPLDSSWEQYTKDTVRGMDGLYMGSTGLSSSSSRNSPVIDNQHPLPGVSIPHFAHQDSSVSSGSLP